jgi:hypothetical protein
MYNPQTNKIIVSKDVVFEESRSWEWNADTSSVGNTEFSVENDFYFVALLMIQQMQLVVVVCCHK